MEFCKIRFLLYTDVIYILLRHYPNECSYVFPYETVTPAKPTVGQTAVNTQHVDIDRNAKIAPSFIRPVNFRSKRLRNIPPMRAPVKPPATDMIPAGENNRLREKERERDWEGGL